MKKIVLIIALLLMSALAFWLGRDSAAINDTADAAFAQLQIMGEYDEIVVTSPSGEVVDLNQEGPILLPVDEVEDYTVRLEGQARWVVIMVSSLDGQSHWLFIENVDGSWITHAGVTAITSYHWD